MHVIKILFFLIEKEISHIQMKQIKLLEKQRKL